jgi:hypothetical protein
LSVVADDEAIVVMVSMAGDEVIVDKSWGELDVVGEECFFGCLEMKLPV